MQNNKNFKRKAFAKVKLIDGIILNREVVEFNFKDQPIRHYPLKEETAFTEWHNCTFVWPEN